jgi:hypothetical protein
MRVLTRAMRFPGPTALTASAAKGLTRRRMLGNAGSLALGATVATAYIGRPEDAIACNSSAPCGPSPLCGGSRCDAGDNYQCDYDEPYIQKAVWGSGAQPCSHQPGTAVNCWSASGTWCCDCCVYQPGCQVTRCSLNNICTQLGWFKCICNGRLV